MHSLAETSIRFLLLLLLSTSLALAAPPASSSAAATSTTPLPPTLQRTCGPSKLSVCCVVSSNSTIAATETATSLPGSFRGQSDGDDTDDNDDEVVAGEEERAGRNETTFDVTPLTVHSCRLKEAGVDCDDLATAACCRVIHVPIGPPEFKDCTAVNGTTSGN